MVILTDKPAGYNLKLYNAQQVLLQSANNPAFMNDTLVFNNAPAAYYFIRIAHGKTVFDSLNCYRLKVMQSSSIFNVLAGENRIAGMMDNTISVYPNPAAEQLTINITTSQSSAGTLLIYDLLGRLHVSNELLLEEGYQSLNVSLKDLPEGNYRILLRSSMQQWGATFLKTNQ